jgi:cysteine sulfinate desulfinase/cysteine desulfurase-like protein
MPYRQLAGNQAHLYNDFARYSAPPPLTAAEPCAARACEHALILTLPGCPDMYAALHLLTAMIACSPTAACASTTIERMIVTILTLRLMF